MRTRSVVVAVVTLMLSAGCTTWTAPAPPAPQRGIINRARLTTWDDQRVFLDVVTIGADSVLGVDHATRHPVAYPIIAVRSIQLVDNDPLAGFRVGVVGLVAFLVLLTTVAILT